MTDLGDGQSSLHASAVAVFDKGVLILGSSGSGKSTLALQLMGFGGILIADDRVDIVAINGKLVACAPKAIKGRIEARGVGILTAQTVSNAPIEICIDMDNAEQARLPDPKKISILAIELPLVLGRDNSNLAVSILQYLKAGRCA